jgi:hypothetical protein
MVAGAVLHLRGSGRPVARAFLVLGTAVLFGAMLLGLLD